MVDLWRAGFYEFRLSVVELNSSMYFNFTAPENINKIIFYSIKLFTNMVIDNSELEAFLQGRYIMPEAYAAIMKTQVLNKKGKVFLYGGEGWIFLKGHKRRGIERFQI